MVKFLATYHDDPYGASHKYLERWETFKYLEKIQGGHVNHDK